ncbi:unnamed protein product [Lymnaea stagnalis]|uniref:BPTI/Kunitz inhibitor domain-containing protein n=1 Tax=Lymnaea stagnalis TaxID=6523 RepID=A0AAV2I3V4_LYMST
MKWRTVVRFACVCIYVFVLQFVDSGTASHSPKEEHDAVDTGELIMREDAEEQFYNVDVDKYHALGIKCPDLEPPENGVIIGEGTRVGSVVYVRCHEGYRLDGPTVMACVPVAHGAQWDPKLKRVCIEGRANFEEETSLIDNDSADTRQESPPRDTENRPMQHQSPSFIDPKVHSSWLHHPIKTESSHEDEEHSEPSQEEMEQIPEHCQDFPEVGPCKAAFKRYFFNKSTFECHSFIYGGCHGNRNNFESLEECNTACLRHA